MTGSGKNTSQKLPQNHCCFLCFKGVEYAARSYRFEATEVSLFGRGLKVGLIF